MKKNLILVAPTNFKLHHVFEQNCIQAGFLVYSITNEFDTFKYPSFRLRALNFLRKIFFNDRNFKKKLILDFQLQCIRTKLKNFTNQKADHALFIRPDLWPNKIIELVTQFAKINICYQWDGFNRYPNILNYLHFFDRVYAFDKYDVQKYNVHFSTNFYFDYFEKNNSLIKQDCLYVGTFIKSRASIIHKLIEKLDENNKSSNFILYSTTEEKNFFKKNVQIIQTSLSYQEMIKEVEKSNIIIDLQNDVHTGLSLRLFESLFFQKKLITNNTEVKYYDFYRDSNIFILKNDNWDELASFLNQTYQAVDAAVITKYSFSNWIKYVLDIKPHIPIEPYWK